MMDSYNLENLDEVLNIGPDKENILVQNCNSFLTHQFKHLFWVLNRIISLKWLLLESTIYVLV